MAQVSEQQQFLVRASFLEIYNEEVRDLLSKNPKNKLDLKERKEQGVYVKGLNSFVVKSVAEITSVLDVCPAAPLTEFMPIISTCFRTLVLAGGFAHSAYAACAIVDAAYAAAVVALLSCL